jgi:serine-type D-Ala-D-Ala carboxypeptidase (penicillin-binding protein 5/6)
MSRRRALLLAATTLPLAPAAWAQQRRQNTAPRPAGAAPSPASTPLGPFDTIARQALIIDAETDAVLLEKHADERMPPSSMLKLMTLYIVFDMLKKGRLKLNQELPISERAWKMQGSKMFVQIGNQVPVEALLRGVVVQSGNDATVALAEGIAGSEAQFVELMTAKARELGLKDSSFRNSTGWPDPEQRMSSRDLARLARRLILDFPEYYHYFAERSFTWNNIAQENRNTALTRVPGSDGLKTGHTEEGGFGLVASAKRGNRRLIMVLNGLPSMKARAEESERLLEWGFREFDNITLFKAGEVIEEVPVYLGTRPAVPLVGGRDMVVTVPRSWQDTMQAKLRYRAPIAAPVLKGQELGRLEVSGRGVPNLSLPLLAGADVEKRGLLGRIPAVIGGFLGS